MTTDSPPILPRHPLDLPGVVKIALDKAASIALDALGKHFFILAAKADCSAPQEARERFVLMVLPVDKKAADDAAAVALGKARAIRSKKPPV